VLLVVTGWGELRIEFLIVGFFFFFFFLGGGGRMIIL